MWRCELCGVKNGIRPDVLTVHHLDSNKWNLLPWNLAALCQRCHREVQWTIDFYQANLTGAYPGWLRTHVEAYNHWAQNKGRPQLALALNALLPRIFCPSPGREPPTLGIVPICEPLRAGESLGGGS